MKIRIHSDLHLEFSDWTPPPADADVIVLAGDIHIGSRAIQWARRHFPLKPILYVPGNHEFYGGELQAVLAALRAEARQFHVDLLDGDERILADTRFLGATLWTDFALYGADLSQLGQSMADASHAVTDFRLIRLGGSGRAFRPADARNIHMGQLKWLTAKLAEPFDGPTVVITHHLPHRGSIHPRYEGDRLNPAFASDLAHLVGPPVTLWIHGHTHESFDYVANGTRIVCNPRGYLPMEPNPAFDPALTVELRHEGSRQAVHPGAISRSA
ncbi:MAG: metallophosphoesterase [Steroidobacteraceae bacterium]